MIRNKQKNVNFNDCEEIIFDELLWVSLDDIELFSIIVNGITISKVYIFSGRHIFLNDKGCIVERFSHNNVSFDMVYVDGGVFNQESRYNRLVKLTDFYICEAPTTFEQLCSICGDEILYKIQKRYHNYSHYVDFICKNYQLTKNLPVVYLPLGFKGDDILYIEKFIRKLNEIFKEQLDGRNFCLPTETQWEYAAMGGLKTNKYKYSGANDIEEVGWYYKNTICNDKSYEPFLSKPNYKYWLQPVKKKQSNELGIYEMSGSVYEWCRDHYQDYNMKDIIIVEDPVEAGWGGLMSLRGGCYFSNPNQCKISYRDCEIATAESEQIGFRLAISKKQHFFYLDNTLATLKRGHFYYGQEALGYQRGYENKDNWDKMNMNIYRVNKFEGFYFFIFHYPKELLDKITSLPLPIKKTLTNEDEVVSYLHIPYVPKVFSELIEEYHITGNYIYEKIGKLLDKVGYKTTYFDSETYQDFSSTSTVNEYGKQLIISGNTNGMDIYCIYGENIGSNEIRMTCKDFEKWLSLCNF